MSAGAVLPRRPLLRMGGRWRPGRRSFAALAILLVLLGGGWLWLRQSSLVAVRQVTVVGVSGANAGRIRSALIHAARRMTTLDVDLGALRRAVATYPDVQQIHVSTAFPHGLRIDVQEDIPVAFITLSGQRTEIAGDGNLLPHTSVAARLPKLVTSDSPLGSRLTGSGALSELAVLSAAPYQFLPRISQVSSQAAHGVVVQLRNGPSVYFGSTTQLVLKWRAVTDVLADGSSAGALYIDVSDPHNPAAGGGAAAVAAAGGNETSTSATATSPDAAAPAAGTATGSTATAPVGTATEPVATTSDTTVAPQATATTPSATQAAPPQTTTAPAGTATDPATTGGAGIP